MYHPHPALHRSGVSSRPAAVSRIDADVNTLHQILGASPSSAGLSSTSEYIVKSDGALSFPPTSVMKSDCQLNPIRRPHFALSSPAPPPPHGGQLVPLRTAVVGAAQLKESRRGDGDELPGLPYPQHGLAAVGRGKLHRDHKDSGGSVIASAKSFVGRDTELMQFASDCVGENGANTTVGSSNNNSIASAASRFRVPPDLLTAREAVLWIESDMEKRLKALRDQNDAAEGEQNRHALVLATQAVFNDVAHELTRQVAAHCVDRGRLLAKLWIRYGDLVNTFAEMVVGEKRRHEETEEQTHKQLRQARLDYVTVVNKMESLIQQQHEAHCKVLDEQALREEKLCGEISQLKEDLYLARATRKSVVNGLDASSVTKRRSVVTSNALPAGILAVAAAATQEVPWPSTPLLGVEGSTSSASPARQAAAAGGSSTERTSAELEVEVRTLKLEVAQQRLMLVDAATELALLRKSKDFFSSEYTQTEPPATEDRGVSPVQELSPPPPSASGALLSETSINIPSSSSAVGGSSPIATPKLSPRADSQPRGLAPSASLLIAKPVKRQQGSRGASQGTK